MKKLILLLPIVFLIVNLVTISDYNVNWDEPVHFMRGQAYLRYLLTRKTNYDDWPGFRQFRFSLIDKTKHFDNLRRYSIYQSEYLDGAAFLKDDGGHPPLNGILAAATNVIVYQKLGLLGDVEAYHFFIILVTSSLVFLVTYWSAKTSGWFAGFISFLMLSLYPMFITESHNNIKDPVEAAFFAFTLYLFYRAICGNSWKFMIGSAILAGLALSTKFNIVFAPVILLPWLIVLFLSKFKGKRFTPHLSLPMISSVLVFPVIVLTIFYFSWPYLWTNSISRALSIISYYRQIGTGGSQPEFHLFGFNTYPIQWILFTSPVLTLILTAFGIISALLSMKSERYKTSLLWLSWLIVPILRASLPNASIYGGSRQFIEFLPAMALLAGNGAKWIVDIWTQKYKYAASIIRVGLVALFIPILFKIIALHPNENLFFNTLIGGLPGAAKRNLPGWGTTLGNPYLQGVKWINKNTEPGANVVLTMGVMTNVPFNAFRPDITYLNNLKSVQWREGEYVIGLTYSEFPVPFYDALYYERFLNPVHEILVDGVPIVRIWKNDSSFVKPGFLHEREFSLSSWTHGDRGQAEASLNSPIYLTRLEYSFSPENCKKEEDAILLTSLDGKEWKREPETLLADQIPQVKNTIDTGRIIYFVAAEPTKFIRIIPQGESCLLRRPSLRVFGLQDISP